MSGMHAALSSIVSFNGLESSLWFIEILRTVINTGVGRGLGGIFSITEYCIFSTKFANDEAVQKKWIQFVVFTQFLWLSDNCE